MANICADCRFYRNDPAIEAKDDEPGRPEHHVCTAIIDLVTGEQQDVECYEARAADWLCGTDGKLFKRRGENGADPRKQHGTPPTPDISGGNRRDMKPGKSDDPAKFLSVP